MERFGSVRIVFAHRERTSSTQRKTWLNSGTFALDRLIGTGSDSLLQRRMNAQLCAQQKSELLVAVREGAILAGPQGPLWHWLSERKHHQAGRLARQRLDLRVVPLQGKVQKRIVRAATRGLPKWPHFSLPPTSESRNINWHGTVCAQYKPVSRNKKAGCLGLRETSRLTS
jgi:hypothetical protein